MCTIAVAHRVHRQHPLIIAANRDEFYARPSAAASFWEDAKEILAGRDLRAGGTWLGITRRGRFAALTNIRDPRLERENAPSRGEIATAFLRGSETPESFLQGLAERAHEYNGFNLLVRDGNTLAYFSNRGRGPDILPPGVYAFSNALLGVEWPKVRRVRDALETLVRAPRVNIDSLIELLSDAEIAADDLLPATGVELEWERALSSVFIRTSEYGTCSSTAIVVDDEGHVEFVERRAPATLADGEPASRYYAFEGGG